jgi:ethanolamine utilization protein EutA
MPKKHGSNKNVVTMIGLDFGSTTSSAMVAHCSVGQNSVSGRMAFGTPKVIYRSAPVFTPFDREMIDESLLKVYLARWLKESGIHNDDLFAGGAIITGLAARQRNSTAIAKLVVDLVGEAIIATADDPCLESWLAFMGCSSMLSKHHADTPIINLDIGGGTTNPALGYAGQVTETGCFFVGARHFQFEPGTYRLTEMSDYGKKLLTHFSISKTKGEILEPKETEVILNYYIAALEAMVTGNTSFFMQPIGQLHQQSQFAIPPMLDKPGITFSGGVGELVYRLAQGKNLPSTTHYGDLGIDLAMRIVESTVLSTHLNTLVPENTGRATVYGLTLHNTEISGATMFLPRPEILPLHDLPLVARLHIDTDLSEVIRVLSLIKKNKHGACIQILSTLPEKREEQIIKTPYCETLARIKGLGLCLEEGLKKVSFPTELPLVILAPHNYGKALGNYATSWQQSQVNLIVIDEIPDRNAHFANIGRTHNNIVPVSFYGMH